MNRKRAGIATTYTLAVINAVLMGLSFLFTKIALTVADPIDTLMYRFVIAFIAISIPILSRCAFVRYPRKKFMKIAFISLLYPILSFSLQAYGLLYATSSEGGILFALTPILTIILASLFLKEKTTLRQKLSISLSVFGVVTIFVMKEMGSTGFHFGSYRGIGLLLLSVLSLAGYSVMSRSLSKVATPMELSFMMMAWGAVFFMGVSFVNHALDHTIKDMLLPFSDSGFILSVVYLGVFSSLVTSLLTNYTLSKIEASKLSVFSNLSTVVSMVAGVLALNENVTYYHAIGFLMVIIGMIGANIGKTENLPAVIK